MARVKYSPAISSIHGKLAGSIFRKTSNGHVLSRHGSRKNGRSINQSKFLLLRAAANSAWNSQGSFIRDSWSDFYGSLFLGKRTYIEGWINYHRSGLGTNSFLPALPFSLLNASLAYSGTPLRYFLTADNLPGNVRTLIYASAPYSQVRNYTPSSLRYIGFGTSTAAYAIYYLGAFGFLPKSGQAISLRIQAVNNGRPLPYFDQTVKVTIPSGLIST